MSQNVPQCPTFFKTHPAPPAPDHPPHVPHTPAATAAGDDLDPPLDELSDRQQAALDLILAGATDTAVADALGLNRKTIHRWRIHDERFRACLHRCRRDLYDHAADRLRSMLGQALDLLDSHIRDPYAPTALRAARTLLVLSRLGQLAAPNPDPPPDTTPPPTS